MTYPAEFKTKIVLELLAGDQTVSQIASKYSLISKSIQNWKKVFLANASLAFNADAAVAMIKNTVIEQEKKIDELHRQLFIYKNIAGEKSRQFFKKLRYKISSSFCY